MLQFSLSPEILTILTMTTVSLTVIILALVISLRIRIKKLFRGKNAKTLEDSFNNIQKDLDTLLEDKVVTQQVLNNLNKRVQKSVQGIGTVRFNPFKGTSGSNQSFVTAFLNEKGDGVVFSSLYSRERVLMFAKPIKNNNSEYTLTEEERAAIKKAGESSKEDE